MDLSDDEVREYARLWAQEFDEQLSDEDARHHAAHLLELYVVLASGPPADESP